MKSDQKSAWDEGASPVVLVGFAEALSAPESLWSLVDAGFKVVAFSRRGRKSALHHSRFVVCHEICAPERDLQTSISDLQSLMATIGAQHEGGPCLLLPLDDKAVYLSTRIELKGSWKSVGPLGSNAELALNKDLQTQAARKAGFNVPRTLVARTAEEILESDLIESFPLIVKSAECVPTHQGHLYSSGYRVCANPEELKAAVAKWSEHLYLLVQPFIAGTGEGIFGIATSEGVKSWSAHRRLRMMNPAGSGSSACISQPVGEEIRSAAEKLISDIQWRGLFMIELLRDESGKTWFVELNGRTWGSMALARRQGLEYPAWQVRLAMEPHSMPCQTRQPAYNLVCRNVGRELLHVLFVMRGAKSKALTRWPSLWSTLTEIFCIRRGDTFYNWRRDDRSVFIADCLYTLRDNLFRARN